MTRHVIIKWRQAKKKLLRIIMRKRMWKEIGRTRQKIKVFSTNVRCYEKKSFQLLIFTHTNTHKKNSTCLNITLWRYIKWMKFPAAYENEILRRNKVKKKRRSMTSNSCKEILAFLERILRMKALKRLK